MAKIVEGVAILAGIAISIVLTGGASSPLLVAGGLAGWGQAITATAISIGSSLTLGAIAAMLRPGMTAPFSVRQPAAPRQIIYGQTRVAGIIVYMSTTDNSHDLNQVIAWATHPVLSIDTVYIDGRAAHIPTGGGQDNGGTYYDDSGNAYTFGSLVTIWHNLGTVPGTYFSDLGSRDSNWNTSCVLSGIASTYVRTHFDQNTFDGTPGIKATVHGKATIWDPRTQKYGYTNNAALVIADFLSNNDYGVGCNMTTEIDQTQLIAAANICDQQVTLANGNQESRYTINGAFDTSSTPGDILDAMLQACEGRIAYTGGQWKIYPGAWYGSGVTFTADDLAGPIKWVPKRKYRDLINAVRGTFVSPKYPYAIVGYNQDNKDPAIWSGEWQPADFPTYAQDSLHGYPSDANLALDGNVKLYADRGYRFVTSVATAQRLAKIYLLRNRQQGSGTLIMKLSALLVQAQDVIQVTLPALGWTNKYLEVQSFRFVPKMDANSKEGEGPSLYCELDVVETDPSVYLWSAAEELGPQNTASPQLYRTQTVNPPTSLTLESGADSAVIGADGVVIPRIHVSWTMADDPFVLSGGYVEIQWQPAGATLWRSEGHFATNVTDYFLTGVVTGQQYNVQARAVRSNGASSAWVTAGPNTVSSTATSLSYQNVTGLGSLATLNQVDFSTSEVANRTAQNLSYANGLSVESLRPAQANADVTANMTQVYLQNPGFEAGLAGWTQNGGSWTPWLAGNGYGGSNGYAFCNSGQSSGYLANNASISVTGGQVVGAQCAAYGWNSPNGYCYLGLAFFDVNWNWTGTTYQSASLTGSTGWTLLTVMGAAPSNAAFARLECHYSGLTNAGTYNFDFVSAYFLGNSSISSHLNAQGSIMPNQPISITYSVKNNSVSFSWSAQSALRSDGTTLSIPAGTLSYSGLSASTTYYTYWYIRVSDGTLQVTSGSPPPTSPSSVMSTQTALDGRIPISPISFTTLASSNTGTGGGTGGGAGVCPDATELVDVEGKGKVAVGQVAAGDRVRGRSFRTNADVYRTVLQVRGEPSVAWRMVAGHRVSPCEPIFYNGEWMPAYRASSQVDTEKGRKMFLSLQSDEYDEQNYYLVAGQSELLIHNAQMVPC